MHGRRAAGTGWQRLCPSHALPLVPSMPLWQAASCLTTSATNNGLVKGEQQLQRHSTFPCQQLALPLPAPPTPQKPTVRQQTSLPPCTHTLAAALLGQCATLLPQAVRGHHAGRAWAAMTTTEHSGWQVHSSHQTAQACWLPPTLQPQALLPFQAAPTPRYYPSRYYPSRCRQDCQAELSALTAVRRQLAQYVLQATHHTGNLVDKGKLATQCTRPPQTCHRLTQVHVRGWLHPPRAACLTSGVHLADRPSCQARLTRPAA